MSKKKKAPPKPANWQNRIVGHGLVPGTELISNPKNWRLHPGTQRTAMTGVLDEVGWVQEVIVNKRTGCVVDGHLRAELAIAAGQKVPVVYVDLDEADEAKILASLDPLASMAMTDSDKLAALLNGMNTANQPLEAYLNGLVEVADKTALADEKEDSGPNIGAQLGDQKAQIKAVLYASQIAVFEQAMKHTGESNRGEALMIICRSYVEQAERQLDTQSKSQPTTERAAGA